MAAKFAFGVVHWLSADAATTTYAVTGLGFKPKAIRFYYSGHYTTVDGGIDTVNLRMGVGFAVAGMQVCSAAEDQDGTANMTCTTAYREDCVAMTPTATGPAVDGRLALQSFDIDGFTLVVDDASPVNITIGYEAYGGEDISCASIITILEPSSTGSVTYPVGFPPDIVMFGATQGTGAPPSVAREDAALMFGAASGSASDAQWTACINQDDGFTSADTDRYALTGECISMIAVAGGNPSARATFTGRTPDGFTLNWLARATTGRRYTALCIQGGSWQAGNAIQVDGSVGQTTTVVTRSRGGKDFSPIGLQFAGNWRAVHTAGTSTTGGALAFGSASGPSARQSFCIGNADGTANAEPSHRMEYDQINAFAGISLTNAMDVDAILSNGFRIIQDVTGGGVANQANYYVAFGHGITPLTINNYLQANAASGISSAERIR